MNRRTRVLGIGAAGVLAAASLAATSYIPWEELTEADLVFDLSTRIADVEGHAVHYETPTEELAHALEVLREPLALRHLAEARKKLGDHAGAVAALEKWAAAEGPAAWAEAARWAFEHGDPAFAYRAAATALPGLPPMSRLSLAQERLRWAVEKPEGADVIAFHHYVFEQSPEDPRAAERFVRALLRDHRADEALGAVEALPPALLSVERKAVLRSMALREKGDNAQAATQLEAHVADLVSPDARRTFVQSVDAASAEAPNRWRAALEEGFAADPLIRLTTYFAGQGRGDAALALLRQMDRRYGETLDRSGWLGLSRLYASIDAIPEAFRARLAAATGAAETERAEDLADLADLSLRAGGRPLAVGQYNDEPYTWVARLDQTPGFWTGGLSLLLTGTDWREALERLESNSVRGRTFATARLLVAELEKRDPSHARLPRLRLSIMERHVEEGQGPQALELLAVLEQDEALTDRARRTALLALRLTPAPIAEEERLYKARLRALAPDGTVPTWRRLERAPYASDDAELPPAEPRDTYKDVLDDALARLDYKDPSHQAAIALILSELDRLPDAEDLWLDLTARLEQWNLDDELASRYEQATKRFSDPSWWSKLARYYVRRKRQAELETLAQRLVDRFRGAEIFDRAADDKALTMTLPQKAPPGSRVRLVRFADFVALRALERFPHSPAVVAQAVSRLHSEEAFAPYEVLIAERRFAVLFVDEGERERYFAAAMKEGNLEERLTTLEQRTDRTPVHDLLLFEGWARLSQFEKAHAAADRLARDYPGDGKAAQRAVSLHRSLSPLDPGHAAAASLVVERAARALPDPSELWTNLGELHEDAGRSERAQAAWRHILDGPGAPSAKVDRLASVLWDYGHMKEARDVIEDGRTKSKQPRLLAFEAGVLNEDLGRFDAAVDEYLAAAMPADEDCFCSSFEEDQRALRRLVQLLGRESQKVLLLARIANLKPGSAADERALAALFPLGTIRNTTPGLTWDVDDWIDSVDQPRDPAGREARQARMEAGRARMEQGILDARRALVDQVVRFVPLSTAPVFLDKASGHVGSVAEAALSREADVAFRSAVFARRAELAATAEDRVRYLLERARLVTTNATASTADAVWKDLLERLASLPESPLRLRAEAEHAAYVEKSRGADAAAATWRDLATRYPWSLGLLDDRLEFLSRTGRSEEGREALAAAVDTASAGHREDLLARLIADSLAAGDLPRAQNASTRLLDETKRSGDDGARLGALRLLARLKIRQDPSFDALGLARAEEANFETSQRGDLFAELAGAAFEEKADAAATTLWIEAVQRRVERPWLVEAAKAARRGDRMGELLGHFEVQQQRSARDVRWAVVVRELRLANHDLEGAIAASKAATAIRPERESLWRETVALLSRAGRFAEGAAFLEGWARPRPADETVAGWRAGLLARGGDLEGALAVERAALAAFRRSAPKSDELGSRTARAARRLADAGLTVQAWRLLAGEQGSVASVASSALGPEEQARLALRNGALLRLLRARADRAPARVNDEPFRLAAGQALREYGRPEQLAEFDAWLLRQQGPSATGPGGTALRRFWPMVEETGRASIVRVSFARRLLATTPGPWSVAPSEVFVGRVAGSILDPAGRTFVRPDLEALWVRELSRQGRAVDLYQFLKPRFLTLVEATAIPGGPPKARRPWTAWLDDASLLQLFAKGAASDPAFAPSVAPAFADEKRYERFAALGARRWTMASLLTLLPREARDTFLKTTNAGRATTALITNVEGTVNDPQIDALRGPLTIGGVLDAPKVLTASWGDWPGPAWFALETLVRHRTKDPAAPLVVLEAPGRGGETSRVLVAARLAEVLGNTALSRNLLETDGLSIRDTAVLVPRLRSLVAAGDKQAADNLLAERVRSDQRTLTESRLRELSAAAEDLGLSSPVTALAADTPVGGGLLAYIREIHGLSAASRLRTDDPVGYRGALFARFVRREGTLDATDVATWLDELWATGAAPLPRVGLAKLGGIWPYASAWLSAFKVTERPAALSALRALPDTAAFSALNEKAHPHGDDAGAAAWLQARIDLSRGDEEGAFRLLDERLAALRAAPPLAYEPVVLNPPAVGEEPGVVVAEESPREGSDPQIARLRAWFDVFRDGGRVDRARERFRTTLRALRDEGRRGADAWRLALEVEPPEGRGVLVDELEQAWIRGEIAEEAAGGIAEGLAKTVPQSLPRWMARWPESFDFDAVARRARAWRDALNPAAAAKALFDGRARGSWSRAEEMRAFDMWRRLTPAQDAGAPKEWVAAAAFWRVPAAEVASALDTYLAAHPYDIRAARAALRTVAPAGEDLITRASRTLDDPALETVADSYEDARILRLRAARGLLATSPAAARGALVGVDADALSQELTRRRFSHTDVDAALADVARIGIEAGDRSLADATLAMLADRGFSGTKALRAVLRAVPSPPLLPFIVEPTGPRAYRPTDLSLDLVTRILAAENRP